MLSAEPIRVGGIQPLSVNDWPGQIAAVLFLRGCPWRCPYCHNPELQSARGETYGWTGVLNFLQTRRGLLDGVVFSGGEPCMQPNLAAAMAELRALGFATGLHTGGYYPERLAEILDGALVDWVGFDVKAAWDDYAQVTGRADSGARARRSLELLADSGVDYELRTTVWPALLTPERVEAMACDLGPRARGRLVLQRCHDCTGQLEMDLLAMAGSLQGRLGRVQVRA
ncbi:MAG: anaerobic ribonucleoside-triphosphate reductase activating protein [Deltaproteobacteria bacterium]|nr:anaerobic ribonucleoside-triphosphate reductase activating protein [Deltaproteobacteria bacterium]